MSCILVAPLTWCGAVAPLGLLTLRTIVARLLTEPQECCLPAGCTDGLSISPENGPYAFCAAALRRCANAIDVLKGNLQGTEQVRK